MSVPHVSRHVKRCHVKICGVTSVADALLCVDAGASAIGLNFVPSSPRCVDISTAREIADAIGSRALVVGVVADLSVETMKGLKDDAHLGCLQLHGDESPEALLALLPHAYKALRIADAADVARAATFPGEYLLADAKVAGALGGTGHVFDWSLVTELAKTRKLTLAGGLTPVNVADAVRAVRPFSVDVASGVEDRREPRKKNAQLVRSFVQMVRSADD